VSFDSAAISSDGAGQLTIAKLNSDSGAITTDGSGQLTIAKLNSDSNAFYSDGSGNVYAASLITTNTISVDNGSVTTDGYGKLTALNLAGAISVKVCATDPVVSDTIEDGNFIKCQSSGGSFSFRLPTVNHAKSGYICIIKDVGGYADQYPIGVYGEGNEQFDGYPSGVIATSGGVLRYISDALSGWWSW
jgi:hypothetical protein